MAKRRPVCSEGHTSEGSLANPNSKPVGKLLAIHDLPVWHYRNKYKHKGYRLPNATASSYVASLFTLHNETADIWTHLIGATVHFLGVLLLFTGSYPFEAQGFDSLPVSDTLILVASLLGNGFIMFMGSWVAHLMYPIGESWHGNMWRIDQIGVVFSICGGGLGWGYFALMCSFAYQAYWAIFTIACLVGAIGIMAYKYPPAADNYDHPERGGALLPLAVVLILNWGSAFLLPWITTVPAKLDHGIRVIEISACIMLSGLVFYISKAPERWLPGYFDYCFSSHVLWHVAIMLACTVYATGLVALYQATGDADAQGVCLA